MIDPRILYDYLNEKTFFETAKNFILSGLVGLSVSYEQFVEDMELDEAAKETLLENGGEFIIKALDAIKDEEFKG